MWSNPYTRHRNSLGVGTGVMSPSATHWVLSNNGARSFVLNGWVEKMSITANYFPIDSVMQTMTT